MPMKDVGVQFADTYRIRLGDKSGKPDKYGNPTMVALTDRIRVTSLERSVVDAFVGVYGAIGEVDQWEDGWEAYLPVTALPIWIMPGDSLSAWWEMWKSKPGSQVKVCERRCDGEVEQSDPANRRPCVCPADIDARMADPKKWCKPMTRLTVVAHEVPILGTGALVTHSLIAARTFPAAYFLAAKWLTQNIPVEAVLRTHTHRGRTTFTFPTLQVMGPATGFDALDPGDQPLQIDAAAGGSAAIGTGSKREEAAGRPAPPAPPAPFDESNEKLVDRVTALALKQSAAEGGVAGKDLADVVQGVTGSVNVLTKVLLEDWDAVESAVYAAIERRAERAS